MHYKKYWKKRKVPRFFMHVILQGANKNNNNKI